MELILTIIALGIVFGRTGEEEEGILNKSFLGLFLFDLLEDDEEDEEDIDSGD